ncbi:MAG: Gfo/Idh/MocA family protein [Opitutales bacterium]
MTKTNYALNNEQAGATLSLPSYSYGPVLPVSYRPKIGLIGCGGISEHHLTAYRNHGLEVVALCDLRKEAAEARRAAFYPDAAVYTNSADLLDRADIEVVDIALHADPRPPVIEAALEAGKHVLSQKPFVKDLETGQRLVDLAHARGLKLAVNQNGRWAPYVRWITLALRDRLVGDVQSVNVRINWDHTWVKGTAFETMRHLILYDFAVHWLDMVRLFFGDRPCETVFANNTFAPPQEIGVPMMASVVAGFANGQASLDFDGHSRFLQGERLSIRGSAGSIEASGQATAAQHLEVETADGRSAIDLDGSWFPDGFAGTMGELLCAIEEDREPENGAAGNLESLKLVFGAIASAVDGQALSPASVTGLRED